ncbi:hypothetical protein EV368DRAFT_84280 [Lentinula lateritia]|uniref:Uncharacterized protein n=1 Tax=Lentinula aff. lateritia TaxID=2804960 RepID=A0ACC1TVT3_9AGAR|nr:hypothetical protein F5876DRAFT_45507 [Lentinula aff. lateritia]KAJ3850709.1 hypothetical protein EV368DRAFT_84280 [Lentinula lateritia]
MDTSSTPFTTSTKSPQIVSDLWFSDGNLILETESSLFKVYSGLLARKSSVFRDMFTFPQPNDHKDVPTVRLYDSTEELTWFLKAILDPEFFEPPPSTTDLSIVGAILRLSSKYDVQFLRRRALLHVQTTYPSTLRAWKRRDTHRSIPPIDNSPFAILPLVREFELDWALPAVLYCLCSYNVSQIIDGVTFRTRHLTLNEDDKRKVLVGRAELVHLQTNLSFRCLRSTPHTDCSSPADCVEQLRKWLNHASSWNIADPLDYLDENWDALEGDLCLACFTQSKLDTEATQREIWAKLPLIFELPSWSELKDLEEKAMDGM